MTGKLNLFADNAQTIRKGFVWQNAMIKRLAALLYAQENKVVDCEAIRQCHVLIKENTGVFSMFRGNMSLCVAALLSLSADPKALFENTLKVYDLLKDTKLRASDYLAVSAFQIASQADLANYAKTAERTRAFYDEMKSRNYFRTGQDDYIFAAMLGLSDLDVTTGAERIEQLYNRLKSEFWNKNSVQSLSQVLVLGGSCDESASRVFELRGALKEQ